MFSSVFCLFVLWTLSIVMIRLNVFYFDSVFLFQLVHQLFMGSVLNVSFERPRSLVRKLVLASVFDHRSVGGFSKSWIYDVDNVPTSLVTHQILFSLGSPLSMGGGLGSVRFGVL